MLTVAQPVVQPVTLATIFPLDNVPLAHLTVSLPLVLTILVAKPVLLPLTLTQSLVNVLKIAPTDIIPTTKFVVPAQVLVPHVLLLVAQVVFKVTILPMVTVLPAQAIANNALQILQSVTVMDASLVLSSTMDLVLVLALLEHMLQQVFVTLA